MAALSFPSENAHPPWMPQKINLDWYLAKPSSAPFVILSLSLHGSVVSATWIVGLSAKIAHYEMKG